MTDAHHVGSILTQADQVVNEFVRDHHAAAIPALITACVGWAIEHSAGDLVRGTLTRAVSMSHDAEAAWKDGLS